MNVFKYLTPMIMAGAAATAIAAAPVAVAESYATAAGNTTITHDMPLDPQGGSGCTGDGCGGGGPQGGGGCTPDGKCGHGGPGGGGGCVPGVGCFQYGNG